MNQHLIDDEQPLLFHTRHRATFPLVSQAVSTTTPVEGLRWITSGQVEADECGAMNQFLGVAPQSEVAHGGLLRKRRRNHPAIELSRDQDRGLGWARPAATLDHLVVGSTFDHLVVGTSQTFQRPRARPRGTVTRPGSTGPPVDRA